MLPRSACDDPVDRALVLASLARPEPDEAAALEEALRALDDAGQAELRARLELNDIGPQVLVTLGRLGLEDLLAPATREVARARREFVEARNLRRLEEMTGLFAELKDRGVDVIVLKGVHFAEVVWGDPAYKKMNDVDVLIRAGDVGTVLEVYRARGYLPLVLFEGGDPEEVEVEKTHHLPSFVSRDLEFVIGTHWGLISPKAGIRLDYDRIWEDARPFELRGVELLAMSPEDNLVHLAVHFHHYKTGLKELMDPVNVARHFGPDWGVLTRRLVEVGAAGRAFYCFSLADALHPMGPGDAVEGMLAELGRAADAWNRDEVALRLAKPGLLTRSRSLYEATIEKAFTRFFVEPAFHRKLARCLGFWACLLFPPTWVLARTNVVEGVGLVSFPGLWWANLGRTGRVMSQSMGKRPWVAAAVVSVVLTLGSLKNYFVVPEKDPLGELRALADDDPATLKKLMDFLE